MEEHHSSYVNHVKEALNNKNTEAAIQLMSDLQNIDQLKSNCWDLIPVITEYLSEEHQTNNAQVFECCKLLLNLTVQNAQPEELLLQIIEEIEETQDDVKFYSLLNPLRQVLLRIPKRRANSIAWSLNAVQTYLNKCEIPDYNNLTGQEKLLGDSSEEYQRITAIYYEILPFYDNIVKEIVVVDSTGEIKPIVCKFLVQLLGKPLAFLDVEVFKNIKSKARIIAEHLVANIITLCPDHVFLLELTLDPKQDDMIRPNTLSVAVLFYLIYKEYVGIDRVPQIYDSVYLFQNSLYLMCTLLDQNNQLAIEKALALCEAIFQRIKPSSLSYLLLDSESHSKFCRSLSSVIVYNPVETYRKQALKIFDSYLKCFDTRASYFIIYNLVLIFNHSGLIGYVISFYKNLMHQDFLRNGTNPTEYFKGYRLYNLLKKFCHLPNKEESDLIELADQITATLNLLRYLIIWDKHNLTQIWNYIPSLEEIYFKPLKKAIELSRAHYKLKIKELEEESVIKNKDFEVSVSVSGMNLSDLPKHEKLKVIQSSLTAFDVIDSLLSRLLEFIQQTK